MPVFRLTITGEIECASAEIADLIAAQTVIDSGKLHLTEIGVQNLVVKTKYMPYGPAAKAEEPASTTTETPADSEPTSEPARSVPRFGTAAAE